MSFLSRPGRAAVGDLLRRPHLALILMFLLLTGCRPDNRDLLGKCVRYVGEVYRVTYVGGGEITIERPDYRGGAWRMTRRDVLSDEIPCPPGLPELGRR
jgi:hypothetical protein